ncbi:M14 family metallocarboxypeptidase [Vibrio sp. Of7-15]|uniref:M14 family metallopeptidase n=1 Tax=Vibrio sp. Of7-15 TaxID=2724879 RepID=UPI001EF30E34|nr:M14 family metallocarboxypeptidase [Vibrio sp. Of7-15]MCG7498108.1 M14 family metallocarboxypeptidase [Vibrio sp. Of7-15]
MDNLHAYPIGTPGNKWGNEEKKAWLAQTAVKRSYRDEVVSKLQTLQQPFELIQYNALSYDEDKYPLYALKSTDWNHDKPTVLITGGVHGYETSGVHGAIEFVRTEAEKYLNHFNIIVAPCVSPWGYETINRWNPNAIDPNRSFYANSPAQESSSLMAFIAGLNTPILAHIDLHETTDTDNSEFRPALAARDGVEFIDDGIPDGFYTVGDTENPMPEFQKAIIDSVRKVTHIAPADKEGKIIGAIVTQEGVINYPKKALGLCGGFTGATYVTTTEVYPDSPKASPEECNRAQVAAVVGALDYILKNT